MYEAFYSLDDPPFVLTPDPRFLLRSKSHHEILAALLYGITSQKGLMALVGDVGTGKTTLCRTLLRELPDSVQSALVLNPHLSDAELIGTILDDLGVERRGTAKGELLATLSQYLLAAGSEGKTVLVIVDEAQQMSVESLEQIRILSNLETATRKLLQILLVGQPELEEKLKLNELRQLDQRIGIRCYLKPLPRKETYRYVEHRLRIAGLPGALPFTRSALGKIHQYSHGIPRVINLVCDRALMAGYSNRVREITPTLVTSAVRNLEGGRHGRNRYTRTWSPGGKLRRAAVVAGALTVLGAGGAAAYWGGWHPAPLKLTGRLAKAAPAPAPAAITPAATVPAASASPAPPSPAAPAPAFPALMSPMSAPMIAPARAAQNAGARPLLPPTPEPTATPVPKPAPGVAALASSGSPTAVFVPAVPAPPRPLAAPVAPGVAAPSVAASAVALSAPIDTKLTSPVLEAQRQLMARLLALWGVGDASADRALPAWPTLPDGSLDIAATAARYQLAATYLPSTSLGDLRAIGLPALVELADAPAGRPYLLRSIGAETAALISPSGEEARFALNSLDPAWTRSAWIVWRNVDQLPPDPRQAMSPTVLTTIALRLQKLGYLTGPLPGTYDGRFQQAVRRFQKAVGGLQEDGVIGPRTTMALSRVVGGRFSPTILEGGAQ
jgi:type II secretory pathway predicted ATPase ExeA